LSRWVCIQAFERLSRRIQDRILREHRCVTISLVSVHADPQIVWPAGKEKC